MSPSEPELTVLQLVLAIVIALAILLGILIPLYIWFMRPKRSAKYRPDEQLADEYKPYERRLVLPAMANNRRPGCVLGLGLALLFGMLLLGMGLAAQWEDYSWFGRIMTILYGLVAVAVLVLMFINFFKNFGHRVYNGREIQLDDHELIIDRSLIDSETPGDDMFHSHLKERYLHEKFYYRIPLTDLAQLTISAQIHQPGLKPRQYPILYLQFTTFEAVYFIQSRFMGGDGEMKFLKHFEALGRIPLAVDERYAEHYEYLQTAVVVKLEQ